MSKKNNNNSEEENFQNLSEEWWKINGKFEILHKITPLRIKYILNNLELPLKAISKKNKLKGRDILDLGCGGGLVCEPLAKLGANVTGVDFIKNNIVSAETHSKKTNLKIRYLNESLVNFQTNKKYDLILMLEIIEHIDDWKEMISKYIRYLKPNGKIIFSTINRTMLSKIFAIFLAEEILKWIPKKTHSFDKLIKPGELQIFLKKNDMKVIDTTGLFFNPFQNEWTLNKNRIEINYFCTAKLAN